MTQLKGYREADDSFWRGLSDDKVEIITSSLLENGKVLLKRNTFPDYWTSDLGRSIQLYNNFKTFGLPFDGGWARNPAWMLDAIQAVETGLREYGSSRRDSHTR